MSQISVEAIYGNHNFTIKSVIASMRHLRHKVDLSNETHILK